MFDAVARPLARLLSFFYDLVPSYAIAISLLTFAVMVILAPLTLKGTRSMLAMQKLSPDVKRLQDKHKNDRPKLNEEVMALYKDNNINPLGGCFPLLAQIPVFLVLYNVISGLTRQSPDGRPNPKYLDPESDLMRDLVAAGGRMQSFGVDLARSASDFAVSVDALPFYGLILAMVLVQYWQQRQVASRALSNNSSTTPQMQQMQLLQRFFPPFFGIISFTIPAGVVLYWVMSSLTRIAQHWAMYRFDPLLKAQVAAAHQEAERFLDEGKEKGGRVTKRGSNSAKKKRKGR